MWSLVRQGLIEPQAKRRTRADYKTLRRELLDGKVFTDLDTANPPLDAWVWTYNHDRPHRGIGMVAPWERFGRPGAVRRDGTDSR